MDKKDFNIQISGTINFESKECLLQRFDDFIETLRKDGHKVDKAIGDF